MQKQWLNKVSWFWPWLSSLLQIWLRIYIPAWLWSWVWTQLWSWPASWNWNLSSGAQRAAAKGVNAKSKKEEKF